MIEMARFPVAADASPDEAVAIKMAATAATATPARWRREERVFIVLQL